VATTTTCKIPSQAGKSASIQKNFKDAERIRVARNEAVEKPLLSLSLGRAYLTAHDPLMVKRAWQDVMNTFVPNGRESSRDRRERAMKSSAFKNLKSKLLVETTADDFRAILSDNKTSTHHFLRCLHNLATGLDWLPWPILPPKLWPKIRTEKRRAIGSDQHAKIVASDQNVEHRLYYELLWEVGAAQTDAACLTADNVDWNNRVLSFQRCKTGEWAHFVIGESLEKILRQLPASG
jgi:hypothetical protein